MERLTERDEFGNADIIALSDVMPEIYAGLSFSETNALTEALNRLAEYEDTGFTPREIGRLMSEFELALYKNLKNITVEEAISLLPDGKRYYIKDNKAGKVIYSSWIDPKEDLDKYLGLHVLIDDIFLGVYAINKILGSKRSRTATRILVSIE